MSDERWKCAECGREVVGEPTCTESGYLASEQEPDVLGVRLRSGRNVCGEERATVSDIDVHRISESEGLSRLLHLKVLTMGGMPSAMTYRCLLCDDWSTQTLKHAIGHVGSNHCGELRDLLNAYHYELLALTFSRAGSEREDDQ